MFQNLTFSGSSQVVSILREKAFPSTEVESGEAVRVRSGILSLSLLQPARKMLRKRMRRGKNLCREIPTRQIETGLLPSPRSGHRNEKCCFFSS